jgi:hypothetical protein
VTENLGFTAIDVALWEKKMRKKKKKTREKTKERHWSEKRKKTERKKTEYKTDLSFAELRFCKREEEWSEMMRRSGKREERYPIALAMVNWSQTHSQTKAAPAPPPSPPGTRPKTLHKSCLSLIRIWVQISRERERERAVRDDKGEIGEKVLDSFLVKGTDKSVRVGDTVLMRAEDSEKPPYVAKIEKIEADSRNNIKLRVRWYYRPEESKCGRRPFHGARELFLSDHYDIQSADTIEGTCTVHTFRNYIKLETVRAEDFFCRFEYQAATGDFTPDRVAVYCTCGLPYNPDNLMIQCEACKDW